MSLKIITFGCRLNSCESEAIEKLAIEVGLQNLPDDVVIINSCAVTHEAERQLCQMIRSIKRKSTERMSVTHVIVVGCAAQVWIMNNVKMLEVSYMLGSHDKLCRMRYEEIYSALSSKTECITYPTISVDVSHRSFAANDRLTTKQHRARAFLKIQDGCNHHCTYCIVPTARGASSSVPVDQVVSNAQDLVNSGYKEIVLTGVDITSYGEDLQRNTHYNMTLKQMIHTLLCDVDGLTRLRLSSIDIAEVDNDLLEFIACERRIMPYLHLSLQSGDDQILKLMRRRHTVAATHDFCAKMRKLREDIVFGADIITGFPTEDENMFQNTCSMISDIGIAYLHVFPYSERANTAAATMRPIVPRAVRIERGRRLRAIGDKIREIHNKTKIGKVFRALLESQYIARTDDFSIVKLHTPHKSATSHGMRYGEVVAVEVLGYGDSGLLGRIHE